METVQLSRFECAIAVLAADRLKREVKEVNVGVEESGDVVR